MAASAGYLGNVLGQTGVSTAFTTLLLTDTGTHITYYITNTAKRFWDVNGGAFLIETSPDGTTWTTATAGTFTIVYAGGRVVFNSANAANIQVRATGYAYPMASFIQMTKWDLNFKRKLIDVTTLNTTGAESMFPVTYGGTVTAARLFADNYFASKVISGAVIAIQLDIGNGQGWEGLVYIEDYKLLLAPADVVKEDYTFKFTGGLFYNNPL